MKESHEDLMARLLVTLEPGTACGQWSVLRRTQFEMETPHPAGALYSTVEHLLLCDKALHIETPVSKTSLESMFTPVKRSYGYGSGIGERFNHKFVEHGGGIAGFLTQISRYPEAKVTVIVLSNFETANPAKISRDLAATHFGEKPANPAVDQRK
jgi:hypothetical protein